MKPYLSIFRLRLRLETQYRGAVLGGFICQCFFGIILIAVYRALYESRPQALSFSHVAAYVWIQQAFFRMILSSDDELMGKIKTGGIVYDLCRPLHLYSFYFARILAQKLMGSLLRAIPMLVFAALLPECWGLSLPASLPGLLCSMLALLLGLFCVSATENITMAATMRTLDPRGFRTILNMLMMFFTGNILPLTLFPDSWQRVLTLFPYAQILDAPIRLYTGEYAAAEAPWILLLQAVWTAALVLLGCLLWRCNQRKLIIQGG